MEIPKYLITGLYRHFTRILASASADTSDTRTLNALRLARKEMRRLGQIIKQHDKT